MPNHNTDHNADHNNRHDTHLREAVRLFNVGKLQQAEDACRQVLVASPDHPQALNILGSIAGGKQDFDAARTYLSKAAEQAPEDAQIRFNLACCFQRTGERDLAKQAFQETVALNPGQLDAWIALGRMHQDDDEPDACIAAFQHIIDADPNPQAVANAYQGIALAEQKRNNLTAALKAYDAMARLNPKDDRAHAGRGWVLRDQGNDDPAIEAFLRASEIRPDRAAYATNAAIVMMRQGDFDRARPLLENALGIDPDNRQTLSALGTLLWEVGDDAASCEIFDYEGYVQPYDDLPVPDGFASRAAFHAALIDEIRTHPSLLAGRATNTTRNGVQTTNIMATPGPAVAALRDMFNTAVSDYIAHPDHQSGNPGFRWQPHWRILGWGVILSSQGHQASHNHPTGMVSGVYYIQIPEEVDGSGNEAGFIEFGPPNEQYKPRRTPPSHRVQPREGRMCLFPSHYWHRTIPFESKTERICIAFDAMPHF